jgi:hypothetical protein
MQLFLAVLVIYGLDMSWAWYVFALMVWILSITRIEVEK